MLEKAGDQDPCTIPCSLKIHDAQENSDFQTAYVKQFILKKGNWKNWKKKYQYQFKDILEENKFGYLH